MGSFGGMTRPPSPADATATAKYLVGLLGNLTALVLYLSSIPTFRRIWRHGTVGETKVYTYMVGIVNCLVWFLYGLPSVQKGYEVMLAVNGIGLLCMIVYTIIFWWFAGDERCFLCYLFIIEGIVAGSLATVILTVPTQDSQNSSVGLSGAITGSIMYALPVAMDVIKAWNTGGVQHIYWPSVAASFVNAVIWSTYARIPDFNVFSFVPNMIGAVLFLLELTAYYSYHHIAGNAQAA